MKERVVVTGLGVVTPVGIGRETFWDSLKKGQSGIQLIQAFPIHTFSAKAGGEIKNFNPAEYVANRKSLKVMARDIQLAVAAAKLGIQDSGLDLAKENPARCGTSMGASMINNELDELGISFQQSVNEGGKLDIEKFGEDGMRALFPLWLLKYLPNMLACHISITYNLQGPSNSHTTVCTASLQALGEGYRMIERGDADVMVCGGADSKINPIGMMRYKLLNLLSAQKDDPLSSCRPFDRKRDGIVPAEGSAIVILENLEHAKKRNARIYAEVIGFGSSCFFDYHVDSVKAKRSRVLAMQSALKDAQKSGDQIDCISASGNSVVFDDRVESGAIHEVFGSSAKKIAVTALKSSLGDRKSVV